MSLAQIFDDTISSMENDNLHSLIVGLCQKRSSHGSLEDLDEKKFLKITSFLLGTIAYNIRAAIAGEIRELEGLPSELYLYFACDDVPIAKLFIQPEFSLTSDDMLHIIKNTTVEHRLLLVEREDLPPEVVQEIMRMNEANVIRVMNKNESTAIFYEYDDSLGDDGSMSLVVEEDDQADVEKENPLDVMTMMFCEKSRFVDIIELLAKAGELSKETVKDLFGKKEVEPISILCKGLGMGEEAFATLAQFRCRRLGQLERLAENAMEAYPQIDDEYAQSMLVDLKGQAARLVKARATI